jgi:hypothetical protein
MKLLPDDQKEFPRFAEYLKVEFPKLKTNLPIIYGLKKWGKMSGTDAVGYLSWGQAPMIKLHDGMVSAEGEIAGFPSILLVNKNSVDAFEHRESLSRTNVVQTTPDGGTLTTYAKYPVYKNHLGKELYSVGADILLSLVLGHAMKVAKTLRFFSWDIERGFAKDVYGGLRTISGDQAI